ncbi:hypothetical protein ACFYE8_26500 [Rhizobium leguminosarum]|uniref:hypothetical protein n=1 Tax=Rhizobium leguminosarum TaxID=384 RepID=UPI0036D89C71
MDFIGNRQIEDDFRECWPLNPSGPLPFLLAERQHLEAAFFKGFPTLRKISSSSVRRALKHTAKRLGIASGRLTSSLDQHARDEALAFKFASLPIGRDALPNVEVHVEGIRRNSRNGPLIWKFERKLPEILWSRFMTDPQYVELVHWTEAIGVSRPDLGHPKDLYITAQCLEKAFSDNAAPLALDDPEFARTILIFAGLLPPGEAAALVETAGRLGIEAFKRMNSGETLTSPEVRDKRLYEPLSDPEAGVAIPPRYEVDPPYEVRHSALPPLSDPAALAVKRIEEARVAASDSFDLADESLPERSSELMTLTDADFDAVMSALNGVRSSRQRREAAEQDGRSFIRSRLEDAFAMAKIGLSPEGLAQRLEPAELPEGIHLADAISHFSNSAEGEEIVEFWQPRLIEGCRLGQILECFDQLPSIRQFIDGRRGREARYVSDARKFVEIQANSPAIADWLKELSVVELAVLADEVDPVKWPVTKAILMRLGLDRSSEFAAKLERSIRETDDDHIRRDLLHFVDPAAVVFDGFSNLQRLIIAERLLDIITFGPIETISDPSLRFGSNDLAGSPVAELINWLIQHLDLFANGSELRELAAAKGREPESSKEPGRELLSFATIPSNTTGFYFLLREAVRERYFFPLVRDGRIDSALATSLATQFVVDDAIEQAVLDVRKSSNRAARIEGRHKARVHAYVRSGKEMLATFVRSSKPAKSARRIEFVAELQRLLAQLDIDQNPLGSKEWLERRVAEIISGHCSIPDLQTLKGESGSVAQHRWTADDTAWAQQSFDLPEFYFPEDLSPLDVAAAALRRWSLGKHLSASEILDGLLGRRLYGEALSFVEESIPDAAERSSISSRIVNEATLAIADAVERFRDIKSRYDDGLLEALTTAEEVQAAIARYDVAQAQEQLDLLEMELQEAVERRRLDALDASKDSEKSVLLGRLLQAGVEGPDEKWLFADLQKKWSETLTNRALQRAHLRVVEKVFDGGLPELAEDTERFAAYALEPGNWLPQVRALDLSEFLDGAADKLRTWGQLAGQLNGPQRSALIAVVRWFVAFVQEQGTALKALDESESVDNLLERVLEAAETIEQAPDPLACAKSLGFIGETLQEASQPDRTKSASASAEIISMIERSNWAEVAVAARSLRFETTDDDSRRMTDVAEFAETITVIGDGNLKEAREAIPLAAKALVAHGSMLSRALPVSQQLQHAYELLVASMLASDDQITGIPLKLPADRSWAVLTGRKAHFQQVLTGNGLPSRTLEQLCSGSLGRDVVNRLWDAPTARSEPGPFRASLLAFLYDRGLNENLLSLAQRHDPGIKSRLEQLVNLRSIATQRPDLIPVSEAVAVQIVKAAQGVPFRMFVSSLPTAAKAIDADLIVSVDNDIILRVDKQKNAGLSVAISIEPRGLVPEQIEAVLFPDDDISFEDGSRRAKISTSPLYYANQFPITVNFGPSWADGGSRTSDNFRIRINARILAGELINRDVVCELTRSNAKSETQLRIDDETLLDAFPGVENTPASGDSFVGRHDELEKLHGALIRARRPSPVLLTGMRRIGKTSLLYAFHNRYRHPNRDAPLTVYFSLAERRGGMMDPNVSVSSVFFSAIAQALGKRHFSSHDMNREFGEKLKQKFGNERDAVRNAILDLRDSESVADSLTVLSESLLDWIGGGQRIIYLIDEAETLVLPYKGNDAKRLELEQLLQGLREVSQTSTKVGLLLCGSNHIDEFTQSYKEAFFGSSVKIPLAGITATETARKLISPDKLTPYMRFTGDPVRYAIDLCAGMPQFLWQLGAATSAIVRSGPVSKADVRQGVSVLVGERTLDLPFKAYEVLEPIEHMLGLQGQREQDLLWLLLYKVANSSSLVVDEAQQSFIIDQSLLELDEFEGWKQRLISVVNLSILEMTRPAMYRFKVPIFAEGFRALRQQQKYLVRHQRAAK